MLALIWRCACQVGRLRFSGPEIAETIGMALSTVSGILTRIGWAASVGLG